jgi:uncharacterized protein (TIGR02266 family)
MIENEKRKHARVPVVIKVTNLMSEASHYYYSKDLSIGGMFLETMRPYPIGSVLELSFALPGIEERVMLEAKVVRTIEKKPEDRKTVPGMGVSFVDLNNNKIHVLSNFLV